MQRELGSHRHIHEGSKLDLSRTLGDNGDSDDQQERLANVGYAPAMADLQCTIKGRINRRESSEH